MCAICWCASIMLGDAFASTAMWVFVGLTAAAVFSYYAKIQCDPIVIGQIKSANAVSDLCLMSNLTSHTTFILQKQLYIDFYSKGTATGFVGGKLCFIYNHFKV